MRAKSNGKLKIILNNFIPTHKLQAYIVRSNIKNCHKLLFLKQLDMVYRYNTPSKKNKVSRILSRNINEMPQNTGKIPFCKKSSFSEAAESKNHSKQSYNQSSAMQEKVIINKESGWMSCEYAKSLFLYMAFPVTTISNNMRATIKHEKSRKLISAKENSINYKRKNLNH